MVCHMHINIVESKEIQKIKVNLCRGCTGVSFGGPVDLHSNSLVDSRVSE